MKACQQAERAWRNSDVWAARFAGRAALVKDICPHFRGLMPLPRSAGLGAPARTFNASLLRPCDGRAQLLRRTGKRNPALRHPTYLLVAPYRESVQLTVNIINGGVSPPRPPRMVTSAWLRWRCSSFLALVAFSA